MYDQLKLDNQLCFRLYTAARLVMQAYYPYFEPLGITYSQYLVLMVLWETDRQPVNTIAKRLCLETNTITPLLQRMEQQGLVTRVKGKEDSRQRIVCLADKGKALEEQAKVIPECLASKICEQGIDTQEITQTIPTLDKLIEGLKQTENRNKSIK